ncbi:MAG: hypothetical protein RBS22_09615, partial [Spongiibacteraceae bacterium]|nr:hypothetical protein [Spongiibacteraceae bacterium]
MGRYLNGTVIRLLWLYCGAAGRLRRGLKLPNHAQLETIPAMLPDPEQLQNRHPVIRWLLFGLG